MLFNVSFEIVTDESAEHGDAESRGFISEGVALREALDDLFATNGNYSSVEAIEANEHPVDCPRWLTVYNGRDEYGEAESRSIHFPETMTAASRIRVARLIGCYGVGR
jgi:hypothetical protein